MEKGLRILVVEDLPDAADSIVLLLEQWGYKLPKGVSYVLGYVLAFWLPLFLTDMKGFHHVVAQNAPEDNPLAPIW